MSDPPRSAHLPPGYEEASPYEGEDLSEYPAWWRRNIMEFHEHGLRPYRPPRFHNGEYLPPVINRLEDELEVDIAIRALNPSQDDDWRIEVDGNAVATIGKERAGEGFTIYKMTSDEFESAVRAAVY
jgi:hypothetical protein